MDKIKKNQTSILNMLIEINKDRIEGYKAALSLLPSTANTRLRSIFQDYQDQSIQFNTELIPLIFQEEEHLEKITRGSGKPLSRWIDVKAMISPSTTKSILSNCETGEEEHEQVYFKAVKSAKYLNSTILLIIESQSLIQKKARNHIKELSRKYT